MVMFTPERIARLREALGWSRTKLAAHLDVTETTIFRWETGERHPRFGHQEKLNTLAAENRIDLDAAPKKNGRAKQPA